jgi:probable selenate reductase FAD-binding subunit
MVTATAYWRPSTIAQAFELLTRPGAVPLAGGTRLNAGATPGHVEHVEVVDLQALHLEEIQQESADVVRVGAMVRLQQLVDNDQVPTVVREAARCEQPSTLRAQGTVGGCIATGQSESELVAALLVHEAVVHIDTSLGSEAVPLETVLADLPLGAGRVVTAVTLRTDGAAAAARTARTSADRAIVAAFVRETREGRRVALTGVAPTPILVGPGDELQPTGDFRGSAAYRRVLAEVLMTRAVEGIR